MSAADEVRDAAAVDRDDYRLDTVDQTGRALAALNRPAESFLHYPLAPLAELAGGMGGGEVDFLGGFSGNGKTTLLDAIIAGLAAEGRRVYCVPLETPADTMRIRLACGRVGVAPGDALSGELRRRERDGDLAAAGARKAIRDELRAMAGQAWAHLYFADVEWLDAAQAAALLADAADFGADVVVIDHVDHVRASGDNCYAESVRVVHALLAGAQRYGLRVLAATQLNNEAVKGDRLASSFPPQPQHVYLGGHKRHVATRMWGLYRPLELAPADPEGFAQRLKAVRAGHADPETVREPHTMGVVCMKHRHYGEREGRRCFLGVQRGRVSEPTDAVRRALEAAQHGIRTNREVM